MLEIRLATSDEDLAHVATIVCSVTPDDEIYYRGPVAPFVAVPA